MSGGFFSSLEHFAHHVGEMAHHLEEIEGHAVGGLRGGGGHADESSILEEGARIIKAEIALGLSGANPFGLAPLSPSTVAKKRNSLFLVETGALAGSVEATIDEHEAVVGSNDDKVAFLELGTSKMPPRPTFRMAGMRAEPKVQAMAMHKIATALR